MCFFPMCASSPVCFFPGVLLPLLVLLHDSRFEGVHIYYACTSATLLCTIWKTFVTRTIKRGSPYLSDEAIYLRQHISHLGRMHTRNNAYRGTSIGGNGRVCAGHMYTHTQVQKDMPSHHNSICCFIFHICLFVFSPSVGISPVTVQLQR
ncbi:hypothetical protein POVWA2_001230 [Plasmodium ovale wallikeri]|uniref:Uncharacterized protein n=1 Tax=Plasmodium ovale wallikeri TaxID=864142 RepID=A0A1A8YH81_PLAOA|nr:hypothetical protein POVWA2_001230 [Plasmodium ovale wallikeri]